VRWTLEGLDPGPWNGLRAHVSADVTVAIVPREKFSCAALNLQSLLTNTSEQFELLYIDGGAPLNRRREVDSILAATPHTLVRTDRYLGPFEAMSIAIDAVQTEYLVIADNDIYFKLGWLEALRRCAEQEGADVVSPLVLIGDVDTLVIHVAGGKSHVASVSGARQIVHEQYLEHHRIDEVQLELTRGRTELVESHCILARTSTWRALGELDPAIGHAANVEELSRRFAENRAGVWFEPASQVVYLFYDGMRFDRSDVDLMNHVWSESWTKRDRQWQQTQYLLDPLPDDRRRPEEWWLADHRRIWLSGVRMRWIGLCERFHARLVGRVGWKLVEYVEVAGNRVWVWSRRAARG
jgi:hypothetical protein